MRLKLLIAAVTLASCESGQPVPTAAENAQLDDAANMLDRAEENLANAGGPELPPADADASRQ